MKSICAETDNVLGMIEDVSLGLVEVEELQTEIKKICFEWQKATETENFLIDAYLSAGCQKENVITILCNAERIAHDKWNKYFFEEV